MDWKKVCLTAQIFATARQATLSLHEPTLLMYRPNSHRFSLPSQLSILPKFESLNSGSWYVRNTGLNCPPVYFPPVDNPESLLETLEIAWWTDIHKKSKGPEDWRPIYLKSLSDAGS
jgi:hypothetical protein